MSLSTTLITDNMTPIQSIKLIMTDCTRNNNKFWDAYLYADGTVRVEYGRVGVTRKILEYPKRGAKYYYQKIDEKRAKNYTEAHVISNNTPPAIPNTTLQTIAKTQIRTSGHPLLDRLIERLVRENIHRIESSTQLIYSETTGLFETPLGPVNLYAIASARMLLSRMYTAVLSRNWSDPDFIQDLNSYLRLIPQNVGMKLNPQTLLPDQDALRKQSDILDSLESTYKMISNGGQPSQQVDVNEKIFDVTLELAPTHEYKRVKSLYERTLNRFHTSSRLRVHTVYSLRIGHMEEAFNRNKKEFGNVMELWHGTVSANLLSIFKSGLQISPPATAKIAGKMFGNGIYFSLQSSKSLNYSIGYWGQGGSRNEGFLLLNDVAVGRAFTPKGATGEKSKPPPGYHSFWAKPGHSNVKNDEIVVFDPAQINPKYLVECRG